MKNQIKNRNSEIPPVQMNRDTKFKFRCHKKINCFTDCCRDINIMLTPYDIIIMKEKLELSSEEFLAIYTNPQLLEKADLPVVILKHLDDDRKSCPFVKDEEGCIIYEERPSTCRYYPLGVGSLSYASNYNESDDFFFTVKESHCKGFEQEKEWTVSEWREDQDVELRDEINAGWTDLIVRKKSVPMSIKLTEKSKQMFFLACYNIDKFRKFIFESTFLKRYDVDEKTVNNMKDNDIQLLQFGFKWMKSTLFEDGENIKLK
ncbi:MAG: zinc/iron-chelating domain-containing protein [Desulfobacteraceae bacterium 4572_130]|nr:MAG: zinc/iron-chelating domain-containing protein [Desulfobacteraceae bacterium 4572_130]